MEEEIKYCIHKEVQYIKREHKAILAVHISMQAFPQDHTKRVKWYNKTHNEPYGVKLLEFIRSVVCGVGAHIQGTWAIIKAGKRLQMFFQRRHTRNYDYMNYCLAYIKAVDYYRRKTPLHPSLVKSKLIKM